jgi:hypothetical protein
MFMVAQQRGTVEAARAEEAEKRLIEEFGAEVANLRRMANGGPPTRVLPPPIEIKPDDDGTVQ